MNDILGFHRYDQFPRWHCWGHLDGDTADVLDPPNFSVCRDNHRWLLSNGQDQLVVVGDHTRDLVGEEGGLRRYPPGAGFAPYLSASLLRQAATFNRTYLSGLDVRATRPVTRAGRPALELHLDSVDGPFRLAVDTETGLWTDLTLDSFSLRIDELTVDQSRGDLGPFALLDWIPDIDLSHHEAPTAATQLVITAVEEASGLTARVLDQDDETGNLSLVLVNSANQAQGLVSRTRAVRAQPAPLFGGAHCLVTGAAWDYRVDTASPDRRRADRILAAIPEGIDVEPYPDA